MAPAVYGVASRSSRFLTNTFERAVLTEEPIIALLLARLAGKSRAAMTFSVDGAATSFVETIASSSAPFPKRVNSTMSFAFGSAPTCFAEALASLMTTFRFVFTIAPFQAISAVSSGWAIVITFISDESLKHRQTFRLVNISSVVSFFNRLIKV